MVQLFVYIFVPNNNNMSTSLLQQLHSEFYTTNEKDHIDSALSEDFCIWMLFNNYTINEINPLTFWNEYSTIDTLTSYGFIREFENNIKINMKTSELINKHQEQIKLLEGVEAFENRKESHLEDAHGMYKSFPKLAAKSMHYSEISQMAVNRLINKYNKVSNGII